MSLYRRCRCAKLSLPHCPHVWWMKIKHGGEVIRESTEQANRHKALLVEAKRKTELVDEGTGLAKPKTVRLKAHIADYLGWARDNHPATATDKDARVLPIFLAIVGDKPLWKISTFDIERWRTMRAKTVIRAGRTISRSTINRELMIVSGCFKRAVIWKRLKVSPVVAVTAWDTDEQAVTVLTAEQRRIVLTEMPPLYAMLCRVTLEALLRVSEVLRLKRTDLGEASLQRRLKGGRVATIPVSPQLIADLRGWLQTPEQVHVFGDPPPARVSVSSQMTRAFRRAGLHGITHHTMRHTGVTDMLEDNVSPKAIQEYAGWTSLDQLERYGHLRDAELQRATAGTAARNAKALAAGGTQGAHEIKGAQKGAHG